MSDQIVVTHGNTTVVSHEQTVVSTGFTTLAGVSDHGGLTGLSDDDHPQYMLRTDAERSFAWVVSDPEAGSIPGPRLFDAMTVTRLDAYTSPSGTVSFNLWERTLDTTGTILISAGTTATVDGVSVTSFTDASWAAGNYIWLEITEVADSPEHISITITCEEVV